MSAPRFDRSMHGYRVIVGRRAGALFRCQSKTKPGESYWKVRFDDGSWGWPDAVMAESRGAYTHRCRECELPFRSDVPTDSLCPNCISVLDRQLGEDSTYHGPSHQFGRRPRRS